MPWQAKVAADLSRMIAIIAPRRVGKSWYVLSLALERSLRKKDSEWVIVGLTRPSVKMIYWSVLKRLNQDMELGLKFHGTELTIYFPNGSKIRLTGAENRAEIEKLRGGQYDGVIIDECKSFTPVVFGELLDEVIRPALMDRTGQLILIGTPGDVLAGPFFEATCSPPVRYKAADGSWRYTNWDQSEGTSEYRYVWSKHRTTLQDNVEVEVTLSTGKKGTLWDEAQEYRETKGWDTDHPIWRREYLGEWVASDNRLVYRYQPHRHLYDGQLPEGHEWNTILGFDMGYRDHDAVVVWAYSPTHAGLYEVYSEKRNKLNVAQMAHWLKTVRDTYNPVSIVADFGGLATKVWETLADEHGLVAEPAEKKEKLDHIELFNTDLDDGLIFMLPDSELGKEMLINRWLESSIGTPKRKEDDRTANDLCDAALYAFRWSYHRRFQAAKQKSRYLSPEWWAEYKAEELRKAYDLAERQRDTDRVGVMDSDWFGSRITDY